MADSPDASARHKAKMAMRKAAQDAEVAAKTIEKGLLMVHTGKENAGHIVRADEVHLPGYLAELRPTTSLPDQSVYKRLPGDVSRVVEKLGKPKSSAG